MNEILYSCKHTRKFSTAVFIFLENKLTTALKRRKNVSSKMKLTKYLKRSHKLFGEKCICSFTLQKVVEASLESPIQPSQDPSHNTAEKTTTWLSTLSLQERQWQLVSSLTIRGIVVQLYKWLCFVQSRSHVVVWKMVVCLEGIEKFSPCTDQVYLTVIHHQWSWEA